MYVESNLMVDEKIAFKFKWHWVYLVTPALSCLMVFGIPWLIYRVILLKTSEVAITDRRLLGKFGILSKSVIDVPLDKIDNFNMNQSLLQRIFNAGQISFKNDGEYLNLPMVVSDPRQVKNQFSESQHEYKAKLFGGKF